MRITRTGPGAPAFMKTLVVLLLLAVALGAGHWSAQRPGEGLDAFVAEALATVERLGDDVADGAERALASVSETDEESLDPPGTEPSGIGASDVAAGDAEVPLGGALPADAAVDAAALAAGATAEAADVGRGGAVDSPDGAADAAMPAGVPGAPVGTPAGAAGIDPAALQAVAAPTVGTSAAPAPVVGDATSASVPAASPAAAPSGSAPDAASPGAGTETVDALGSRVAALENELTRTMTSSESSVVQSRLDEAERRLVETEQRLDGALAGLDAVPAGTEADTGTGGAAGADATAVARLDALDGRLALLGRQLDENGASTRDGVDALADRIDALAERLDAVGADGEAARATLAERVAEIGERTETLDARLGTFVAGDRVERGGTGDGASGDAPGARAAAGGGAGIDTALAATSLRVPGLGAALPTGGAGDRAGASGGAGRTPGGASGLSAVDRRLAALESKLRDDATDSRRLRSLDAGLGAIGQRLDALAERDARRADALEALEASVGELATRSDALSIDAVQGRVREELQSLAAEVGPDADVAGADVASLVAALEATSARVAGLEARVRDLPASSPAAGDAQETQSALESQIRALGRRIETLPRASDAALVEDLDEVRERVRELATQGFVTQEELRAQVAGRNVEYKIYFDKNSTEIGDEAATVLDSFIAQETNRTSGVSIFGFTDTKGSATYNQQLAQRRAANVRSYLIRNGFDYTKIDNVAGLGEDAAAAILGDEQEDAGQRVVVLFAAQL